MGQDMTGPEHGAEVDVHSDNTFNVSSYDNDYFNSVEANGGFEGRGK